MLEQLMDLDSGFLMYIQEFMRNDAATRTFRGITTLGNAGAVWIAISLLLLVPKKTRRIGCMGLLALVLSLLFNNMLLKHLIARSRPYDCIRGLIPLITPPTDYSFPSGHTLSSFVAAFLISMDNHKFGYAAIPFAALKAQKAMKPECRNADFKIMC